MSIRDNLDISAYLVLGPENYPRDAPWAMWWPRRSMPALPASRCAPRWQAPARSCTDRRRRAGNRTGWQDRSGRPVNRRPPGLRTRPRASRALPSTACTWARATFPSRSAASCWAPMPLWAFSARCEEMLEYVKTADMSLVDYLGIGPPTRPKTKRDCGRAARRLHHHQEL